MDQVPIQQQNQAPYQPFPQYPQEFHLQENDEDQKQSLISRLFTLFLEVTAILLLLFYLARIFVLQEFTVSGTSMLPNVKDDQILVVNTFSYKWSNPQRGDIVVLIPPINTQEHYVKRIIGLPGEKVEIKGDDQVIIFNDRYKPGIHLNEDYLSNDQVTLGNLSIKLKEDEYFIMGDNRKLSSDSRGNLSNLKSIWQLPKQNIVGKAIIIKQPGESIFTLGPFAIPRLDWIKDPEYNL